MCTHCAFSDTANMVCEQNYWKTHTRRGTMYGMLLESIQHYVQEMYGEDLWQATLDHAGLKNMIFTTHKVYKDEIMVDLANSCSAILGDKSFDEYMFFFGQCFVDFCRLYGYDKVLRVAGRHYRDFLYGIDNLHETIRFSYPKLQSPSFIVDTEDENGCVLTYRSKRIGFAFYVTGQLTQCAKRLYNVDVSIQILQEIRTDHGCHVKYRLDFQNTGYSPPSVVATAAATMNYPRISSSTFFKLFPFCLLFDSGMIIRYVGVNLSNMFKGKTLVSCKLTEQFGLRRPLVDFTWENVLCLQRVIFEVESYQGLGKVCKSPDCRCSKDPTYHTSDESNTKKLLLRGQMKYVDDWACMAFLCTPLIGNLEAIEETGLYVNDLNMFDNSQDMVLAGWHHASQLEYLVDQQIETSKQIADNLQKLDKWRHKSNSLLYSMMPESIAVRLKNGEDPIKTCETFDQVTIMFSYLIGFSEICAHASAFQVVECINNVFTVFDAIVDSYKVFKVETLGDAVYMVAGGVPDRGEDHTQRVAGLALEFVDKAKVLKDPLSGNSLQVRIGMHVGGVVAGIVGKRTPQYCLFGDTVNTASRMQSYSQASRIHVSQSCHENLNNTEFITIYRGRVNVKGKGEQKTYWLAGRRGEASTARMVHMIHLEQMKHKNLSNGSIESGFDLHGLHMSTSGTNFAANFTMATGSEEELDNVFRDEQTAKVKPRSPLSLSEIRYIDEEDDDDDEEEDLGINMNVSEPAAIPSPTPAGHHTLHPIPVPGQCQITSIIDIPKVPHKLSLGGFCPFTGQTLFQNNSEELKGSLSVSNTKGQSECLSRESHSDSYVSGSIQQTPDILGSKEQGGDFSVFPSKDHNNDSVVPKSRDIPCLNVQGYSDMEPCVQQSSCVCDQNTIDHKSKCAQDMGPMSKCSDSSDGDCLSKSLSHETEV